MIKRTVVYVWFMVIWRSWFLFNLKSYFFLIHFFLKCIIVFPEYCILFLQNLVFTLKFSEFIVIRNRIRISTTTPAIFSLWICLDMLFRVRTLSFILNIQPDIIRRSHFCMCYKLTAYYLSCILKFSTYLLKNFQELDQKHFFIYVVL